MNEANTSFSNSNPLKITNPYLLKKLTDYKAYQAEVQAQNILAYSAISRASFDQSEALLLYKYLQAAGLVSDPESFTRQLELFQKKELDYLVSEQFCIVLVDFESSQRAIESLAEHNLPLVMKNETAFEHLFRDLFTDKRIKDRLELKEKLEQFRLFTLDQNTAQPYTPPELVDIRNYLACL